MKTMHWDWDCASYFGAKLGRFDVLGERIVLAQVFNRELTSGPVAGMSLLQVGHRHLVYIGLENSAPKLCLGFLWLTAPHS